MKYLSKIIFGILALAAVFMACEKVGDLPYYNNGSPVVLSSSTATTAPVPADSNKTVLTLNWTSPNYGTTEST